MDKDQINSALKQFSYSDVKLKLTLGVLIVVLLCAFLIVIATFTEFSFSSTHKLTVDALSNPVDFLSKTNAFEEFLLGYKYIPQVPVVLFISALLGSRFGFISVFLYILAGLVGFPVFALGGGLDYLSQHNFGYILAFIPAVIIAGNILSKITFKNALKAVFFGVLLIHFIGVLYAGIIVIFQHVSLDSFATLIAIQSGIKVIYDFVFSLLAVLFAYPVKRLLWLTLG